jgi:hypothetical protein
VSGSVGDRFEVGRPLRLGAEVPAKLARREITRADVQAVLQTNVIVDVIETRRRYVLLGVVKGRPLVVVVADDELDDAVVLVSAYEPDEEHGWTQEKIQRTLRLISEEER